MNRKEFLRTAAMVAAVPALNPNAHSGPGVWPHIDPDDEAFWQFVRSQFPLTDQRVYFNTGGLGASPYPVIDAVKGKMDELERISETGHTEKLWAEIKDAAGAFFGCDADELAFTRNATEGINIVCNGLPLEKGDEVITSTHEHVGNSIAWLALQKRKGVLVKFFEPSTGSARANVERIERLCTKRTRLISIPHATTTTGQILPIEGISQLAKARKIWLFVDGAQTAGMFPFNLHEMGCDAFATSGHKWMLGPKETGFLYVRKDMLDVIKAKFVGAYSDAGFDYRKGELKFHPSAQRYEYGTVNIPMRAGLGAAIGFLNHIGLANVWKRDKQLSTYLFGKLLKMENIRVLSPESDTERSAMVTFIHDKVPYLELQSYLAKLGFRTRGIGEANLNAMRISCHIYNNFEELDRLIENIRKAGTMER